MSHNQNGKGDSPRPKGVSWSTWDKNWDKIFKKKNNGKSNKPKNK